MNEYHEMIRTDVVSHTFVVVNIILNEEFVSPLRCRFSRFILSYKAVQCFITEMRKDKQILMPQRCHDMHVDMCLLKVCTYNIDEYSTRNK